MSAAPAVQGRILFAGFFVAQACAFVRNAILGHALSKGDFGVAATITIFLQVVEMISDLGSDRLVVQAADGARARFLAGSHAILVARGVCLTVLLLALAPLFARSFGIPDAVSAFQIVAFAPLIKGFLHLDFRRAQRRFNNRPFIAIEAGPQIAALALLLPAFAVSPDYHTVAWLTIAQAAMTVLISHYVAKAPYRLTVDVQIFKRHVGFGWPILLSAIPLVAVLHGDRMIVGSLQGMEALAGFTAAFTITMAPALLASKVGHALMLPIFSSSLRTSGVLGPAFREMTELTVLTSALYLSVFMVAGGALLQFAFGSNFSGYGDLTAALAAMWALRMVQAVPGMALMAKGETVPLLIAGAIRAAALPFVFWSAHSGASLSALAAIGASFELASLAFVAWRVGRTEAGLTSAFVRRAAILLPVGLIAGSLHSAASSGLSAVLATIAALTFALVTCAAAMPTLRLGIRSRFELRDGGTPAFAAATSD